MALAMTTNVKAARLYTSPCRIKANLASAAVLFPYPWSKMHYFAGFIGETVSTKPNASIWLFLLSTKC